MKQLRKKGIISRKRAREKTSYKYYLEKYIQFEEASKGRSRQLGRTRRKILNLLSENNFTTVELAEKVGLERNSLMCILRKLESEKGIRRVRKQYSGAQPTVVWAV